MANILIAKVNGRIASRYILSAEKIRHIKPSADINYEVIDSETGLPAKEVKVKTVDKDLVIEINGKTLVIIEHFFDSGYQVSYLSDELYLTNNDNSVMPPGPPPQAGVSSALVAPSGTSLPTIGLAGAGIIGGGAVVAASSNDNPNETSADSTDSTNPTVIIQSNASGTVNTLTGDITYTFTFSETVTGFTTSDITLSGGTAGTFTAVSDTIYTLVVTPDNNFVGDITVDVAANAASDSSGNGNTSPNTFTLDIDTIVPTATITLSDNDLTQGETATVTITFSKAVENFTLADLTAENGTLSGLNTVDNVTWTATFTPDSPVNDNTNMISLADTYTDNAGNPGTTATSPNYEIANATATVVFDLTTGNTTDVHGRSFQAGFDYTIYIQVRSNSDSVIINAPQRWVGANFLDAGDTIILVGNGTETNAFSSIGGWSSSPITNNNNAGANIFWFGANSTTNTSSQQHLNGAGFFIRRWSASSVGVDIWDGTFVSVGVGATLNDLPTSVVDP